MKKNTFYSLALMVAFSMSISTLEAQIQVSKQQETPTNIAIMEKEDENKDLDEFLDRAVKDETVEMAQPEKQNIEIDYLAPLSGGVLLLSCLGGAYLLGKRRKE
jgi:hypothetical protein